MKKEILLLLSIVIIHTSFAQVSYGDSNAIPVELRFNFGLTEADSGVGLNGSFNNWDGGIYPMKEYKTDWWKITLDLLPSDYEYKFVTYEDTAGQEGITGYFTDRLNPLTNGYYNNSLITVKNPMIYYFLPKNGTILYTDKTDITANIAVANNSQLDINRIIFKLDSVEIPDAAAYYNPETKLFIYTPGNLSYKKHSSYLKVYNTQGDSAELTTTFTLASHEFKSPLDGENIRYLQTPIYHAHNNDENSSKSANYLLTANEIKNLQDGNKNLSYDEEEKSISKIWLKPGSVLALHHMLVKNNINQNDQENFLKNEYFKNWADLMPGSRVFYLKGDRGERKDQHVFFWIFESLDERNRYWPTADSSSQEYNKIHEKINWLYTKDKFLKYAAGYDYGFTTDFIVIAPNDDENKSWLQKNSMVSLHYIKLKPNADTEKFEEFIINEWAPLRSYATPGSKVFFLKGERGVMKGEYVFFWAFESKEARDKYFPKADFSTPLFNELQKNWKSIYSRLEEFSNGWKTDIQTDYMVIQ